MNLTIRDIAKLAGVSPATVSKTINNYSGVNEETRRKVQSIIEETGYQPTFSAKALATKKSNLIGLVYAGKINVDIHHPFFNQVIASFNKEIGRLGYDLLTFSNETFKANQSSYIARCRHFQIDGCLIIAGEELEDSIKMLDQSDIPCVGIDLKLEGQNSSFVMTDNHKISSEVVEHFYKHSIKDIAYIGGKPDNAVASIRTEGFFTAMKKFGLSIKDKWVQYGTFFEDSGYEAMKRILEQKPYPEAVFVASDLMALGAIRACKEHGLQVPQDIRIVGCDDIEACRYSSPQLTTVKQDKIMLGKLAARMLNDIVNANHSISPVLIDPTLIIRQSCGLTR